MANQKLLEVFLETKRILCKNDYYIHIPKKIIHVTNTENMIPHLMGMQYVGRTNMFTGDKCAYMIKKGRIKYDSLEKLVRKYYRGENKQASLIAMVKSENKKMQEYHCNSFMVDYKKNDDYDLHYRNLTKSYEITKIVREDKITKRAEVIYQSKGAEERELAGIEKMLLSSEVQISEKLVKAVFRLNQKFGEYHTLDMLADEEKLMGKCRDKRDEALVKDYINLWRKQLPQ